MVNWKFTDWTHEKTGGNKQRAWNQIRRVISDNPKHHNLVQIRLNGGKSTVVDNFESIRMFKWSQFVDDENSHHHSVNTTIMKRHIQYLPERLQALFRQRISESKKGVATLKMHVLLSDVCDQVDHINRISLDNRTENLRPVNAAINSLNRSTRTDSKTGVNGVSLQVGFDGRLKDQTQGRTRFYSYDDADPSSMQEAREKARSNLHSFYLVQKYHVGWRPKESKKELTKQFYFGGKNGITKEQAFKSACEFRVQVDDELGSLNGRPIPDEYILKDFPFDIPHSIDMNHPPPGVSEMSQYKSKDKISKAIERFGKLTNRSQEDAKTAIIASCKSYELIQQWTVRYKTQNGDVKRAFFKYGYHQYANITREQAFESACTFRVENHKTN